MKTMGRIRQRAAKKRAERRQWPLLSFIIFVCALGVAITARFVWLFTTSTTENCSDIGIVYFGDGPESAGLFDTVYSIGLLLFVLQCAVAINGALSRRFKWTDIALGAVNMSLAGVLVAYSLLSAAFIYPHAGEARDINSLSRYIGGFQYQEMYSAEPREMDPATGWHRVSETVWENTQYGLQLRLQTIRACWNEDFVQANFEARFPDREFQLPGWVNRQEWLWHDSEGRLIDFGDGWPDLTDELSATERSPMTYAEFTNRMELIRRNDSERPTAPGGTPLLSYDEILAIVEQTHAPAPDP